MGLVDVGGDVLSAPGDLATFSGGDSLPSPFSLLTRSVYPIKLDGVKLPSNTTISVKARKNIIITDIPGGESTVKEQISRPDYDVSIEGVFAAKNNKSLLNQLDLLVAIWQKNHSVQIICPYTEKFGIKQVAIQNFEAPPKKGFQSVMTFKFEALSDNATRREIQTKDNAVNKLRGLVGL